MSKAMGKEGIAIVQAMLDMLIETERTERNFRFTVERITVKRGEGRCLAILSVNVADTLKRAQSDTDSSRYKLQVPFRSGEKVEPERIAQTVREMVRHYFYTLEL